MENKCINCNMVKEEHKRKVEMCKICDEVKIKIQNCPAKYLPKTREELEQEFKEVTTKLLQLCLREYRFVPATLYDKLEELFYNVLKRVER